MARELTGKRIVLDANILLRGVFGVRVRGLLEEYEETIEFYAPDICFGEARRYIPALAVRRHIDAAAAQLALERISGIVAPVHRSLYVEYEDIARARISARDLADWPVVATSLLLACPIWTEDRDFFGCGVATWTAATVELYLRGS